MIRTEVEMEFVAKITGFRLLHPAPNVYDILAELAEQRSKRGVTYAVGQKKRLVTVFQEDAPVAVFSVENGNDPNKVIVVGCTKEGAVVTVDFLEALHSRIGGNVTWALSGIEDGIEPPEVPAVIVEPPENSQKEAGKGLFDLEPGERRKEAVVHAPGREAEVLVPEVVTSRGWKMVDRNVES